MGKFESGQRFGDSWVPEIDFETWKANRPESDSFGVEEDYFEAYKMEIVQEESERQRNCDWWYANRPDGEGVSQLGTLYEWVAITDGEGKSLATFFLAQNVGKVQMLFVASLRKGKQPNPFEKQFGRFNLWFLDYYEQMDKLTKEGRTRGERSLRELTETFAKAGLVSDAKKSMEEHNLPAPEDAHLTEDSDLRFSRQGGKRSEAFLETRTQLEHAKNDSDVIPVTGVATIASRDGNTRFKFKAGNQGFSVRGSKLVDVLLAFRRAGHQEVSLSLLRRALAQMF